MEELATSFRSEDEDSEIHSDILRYPENYNECTNKSNISTLYGSSICIV
jgi:hypothetical protein